MLQLVGWLFVLKALIAYPETQINDSTPIRVGLPLIGETGNPYQSPNS